MANTVKCPNCGCPIEITEVIKDQISSEIRESVADQIQKEFEEKNRIEIQDLTRSLAEKQEKLKAMQEAELKLREEKRRLEDKEKELELEVARKIDEKTKEIQAETGRKIAEEHRLKELEKDKMINDLKKSLDEAQRKAQVSSQQLQGEVLELDLESTLRESFPQDNIEPVGKGIRGADIRQTVRSPKGTPCGIILWESKRTKAWSDEWLGKLKEDLRASGANIPVIVTTVLPSACSGGLGLVQGVWVVSFPLVYSLAVLIRKNLLDVTYQRLLGANKETKSELLYEYITGHEFRSQVEALVETYREMEIQIAKERMAFEKIWKSRESQLKRLVKSTVGVYGSVQGLVGASMPQIKGLELLESGHDRSGRSGA